MLHCLALIRLRADPDVDQCEGSLAPLCPQGRLELLTLSGFNPVCVRVDVRHWQRGCNSVKGVGGSGVAVCVYVYVCVCVVGGVRISIEAAWLWFSVTAPLGMWGQQARQARLPPLIFICFTVCFAFKSLAEREALDTPWMAQDPVHFFFFLKTQDPFSKLRGSRTEKDDVWRGRSCAE